jgi:hypothetical protein
MNRRGKLDRENKRNDVVKKLAKEVEDNKNTNIIYVLSPYVYRIVRDSIPYIRRQAAGPPS